MFGLLVSAVVLSGLQVHAQTYSATYLPSTAPDHTEQGQSGTNKCGTTASDTSMCQNLYINSVEDFCVYAPPKPGAQSAIGVTERIEVAWCMKDGYGTRLVPDGTMKGVHFVQTPDYVQVTGTGDFTKMNVPAGDEGGELDPHGADGNGNPIGGLVFSSAFGELQQIHEWTNFMSATQFCFRACNPAGPRAAAMCQHVYDVMGCDWNMPGNYASGTFENCQGDSPEPMGVYGKSTFHQGNGNTPAAHPVPSSSLCTTFSTISNGAASNPTSTPSGSSSGSGSSTSPSSGSSTPTPSPSGTAAGGNSGGSIPSYSASTGLSIAALGALAVFSMF